MTRHLLIATLLAGVLFTPSAHIVTAKETSSSPSAVQMRNKEIREAQKEFRGELKDAIATRKASISAARQTFRSERAKKHAERLERHFNFYAERLTNIATRIQTRIDKEKAEGKDVTTAQTSLMAAKTTLATAVSDGQKAVDLFAAITVSTWDVQQPQIKTAIDQAQKARLGFVNARKQMADAVQALATN